MGSSMRVGLGLNTRESWRDLVVKGVEAERLGLDILWVGDLPGEAYASIMAATLAESTRDIKIGLGLVSPFLHRPSHIASMIETLVESYGPRFELCVGPGDKRRLAQVGVQSLKGAVEAMKSASIVIRDRLKQCGVKVRLWLGAQGPKMLEVSNAFDGVLMNLSSLRMVRWALRILERMELHKGFRAGVFAVSYIYNKLDEEAYSKALQAAATIVLGASPSLLEEFGYSRYIRELYPRVKGVSPTHKLLPEKVLREFSIIMSREEFIRYLSSLESLGVGDLVLAYPQNYSFTTIKDLGRAVTRYKQLVRRSR